MNLLSDRSRISKWSKSPMYQGTSPLKRSLLRLSAKVKLVGILRIVPLSLLFPNWSSVRDLRLTIVLGIEPLSLLPSRFKVETSSN